MHDLPDHQVDYWADRVNPGVTSSVTAARDSWMTSDLVAAKACFRNHFANSVRRNFSISCIALSFAGRMNWHKLYICALRFSRIRPAGRIREFNW